ncbi:pancreatic lipase-related protein 2-like [Engystomops pustulosus]|uniref:pancreatic lipase-related protein 2-like n=1 Tax=Engystomops pustulosus TaxID=76066 RepID=UPI003AFA5BD5
MLDRILPVLSVFSVINDEICYDRLGCFTNQVPWSGSVQRPVARIPWAPEKINTRFLLFTRENLDNYQEVTAVNHTTISNSNFNVNLKSHFIIHGFTDSGEKSWLVDMCQAMLEVEDVNCFCIDWSRGSQTLYTQAANNIRVVGAEVAYFIKTLQDIFHYNLRNVHLIGHSLGAHAAGEAGRRLRGIGRITGLDPAQPYFKNTPPEVRLDPSDALLVDAIHTDTTSTIANLGSGGYGISHTVGHLDFFPNGGKQMPGCKRNELISHVNPDDITSTMNELVACNHLRSYQYYTESILHPDGFIGYRSSSYDAFLGGEGFPCPADGCPSMGHYASKYQGITSNTQIFYLNTRGQDNKLASWRYKIAVHIAGDTTVLGNIAVSLQGSKERTAQYTIYRGLIRPDTTFTYFIDAEFYIGSLSKVTFIWSSDLPNIFYRTVTISNITAQYGTDGAVSVFCDGGKAKDGVYRTLSPCAAPPPLS